MTSSHPRKVKTFISNWEVPDKEALINGNADIPNIYQRQNCLVGQVLDACLILHVYEELKQETHYDQLKGFFTKEFTKAQFTELANAPDNKKLEKLVEMSKHEKAVPLLKGHRLLVKDKQWKKYSDSFQEYLIKYDSWKEDLEQYKNNPSEITVPDKPIMPIDPRISAVNEQIKPTIQLLNPGSKEQTSIEDKAERKNTDIRELADINRIGVLPTKLEYAKDFIDIMNLLNPPKEIGGQKIDRLFVEQPQVYKYGYYNQKLFVALDKCADRENITKDGVAAIAEIKIVPAEMLEAEKLSATIKPLRDKLEDTTRYIFDPKKHDRSAEEKVTQNRRKLEILYAKQKKGFEDLAKEQGVTYEWPTLNKQNMDDPETYTKLSKDFFELATKIHVDAIKKENRTWVEEYLIRAITQELSINPNHKKRLEQNLPTDTIRSDKIEEHWLKEIASSHSLDLKVIKKKVKEEMGLQIAKHQAQR